MLFGKLPSHGDFISRGLTDNEVARLDDWLSTSLSEAAVQDGFDDLYALAPAWRFVIELDGWTACGVMAPSADRVGRAFPIMAGVGAGQDLPVLTAAAEAVLYDAFAQGLTADELFGRLTAFPDAAGQTQAPPGWVLEDETGAAVARLDGSCPPGLLTHMIEAARQVQ
jgi:type VI secretion system protein ImpM